MPTNEYNPNSIDSQLATIIQRLGEQDKVLLEIKTQFSKQHEDADIRVGKVEERLTGIEKEQYANSRILLAVGTFISFVVSAITAWACKH